MAPRKSERLVSLTICLLAARRYVAKGDLRQMIEGYHGLSDAAFERMFERDKDELRRLGVPLATGSNSHFHDDELGYRIERADFELPPIDLTPAEATAVALAARMWQEATMAEHTQSALAKLRAAGAEPDAGRLAALAPAEGSGLGAAPGQLDALLGAIRACRTVRFGYRDETRTLQPWLVTLRRGAWYVTGHDVDRDDARMFRLSRIRTDVEVTDAVFPRPDPAQVQAHARRLDRETDRMALLALAPGAGPHLRRQGRVLPDGHAGAPDGFDVVEVPYSVTPTMAGDVAALGEDAHVLGPDELVQAVVTLLQAVAR